MKVGLFDIYYALITQDAEGKVSYGKPKLLSPGMKVDLSIDVNEAKLYAGNRLYRIIREFKEGKITLSVPEIKNEDAKTLLGARIDKNGGLVSSGEDSPPFVALGFKTQDDGDVCSYFWFYKVKFGVPSESYQTKGESAAFQTPTLEGVITTSDTVDVQGKHQWKYEMCDGEPGSDPNVIKDWFEAVVIPKFDEAA